MLVETREREREQQAPTRELGLHPPCFISGETEARGWKVTYRVVQAMHGSAGEKDSSFLISFGLMHFVLCLRDCGGSCETESKRK